MRQMPRPFARPGDTTRPAEPGDEFPGLFPFTRGIQPTMYRGRLWTMRQYAGFGTAAESNARYRYLLDAGRQRPERRVRPADADGLRLGPPAGRRAKSAGSASRSTRSRTWPTLFDGIPLDRVSTSMTINATAIILLALYVAVGRRQGVPPRALSGTIQNDILKEYVARGTYIYPPRALAADRHRHLRVLRARAAELEHDFDQRLSHPRSRLDGGAGSGVHVRERDRLRAGGASTPGLDVEPVRPAAVVLLQRAQRFPRGDRQVPRGAPALGAHHARSLRRDQPARRSSCASTRRPAGSTLTAQQPDNNIVRVALQALAAVLGGTQSLHCNGRDEALALPTEESARIALRTQQIIAAETGVANTVDPLAGACAIEQRTDAIEARRRRAPRRGIDAPAARWRPSRAA